MRRAVILAAVLLAAAPPAAWAGRVAERQHTAQTRRAEAASVAAEVERLRAQLVALGAAQATGEVQVGGRRSALGALNAQEAELRARMAADREDQVRILGALQFHSRHPPPALLVSPRSAKDAVRAAILLRAVAPALEQRAERFAAEAGQIRALRRQTAAASERLFLAESQVADREARIEDLIAEKSALERSLLLDAEEAEADARRLAATAGSLGMLITQVGANGSRPSPTAAPLAMTAPVVGERIRAFGAQSPAGRSRGVTWRTAPGALVRSPVAGRVQFAGELRDYGVVVIVRAGARHDVVLAGLQSAAPPPGGRLALGEPIGRMPTDSDVPELYLELRDNGAPVDPARRLQTAAAPRPDGLRGALPVGG